MKFRTGIPDDPMPSKDLKRAVGFSVCHDLRIQKMVGSIHKSAVVGIDDICEMQTRSCAAIRDGEAWVSGRVGGGGCMGIWLVLIDRMLAD